MKEDIQNKGAQGLPSPKAGNSSESTKYHHVRKLIFHLFHTIIAVDLLQNWRFCLYLFSCRMFINIPINYAIHSHLPDFIVQAGHENNLAWIPLVIAASGNSFGKFLIGTGERCISLVSKVFCLAVFVMSIGLLVIPFMARHCWFLCVWAGIFGTAEGLFHALSGPILAEIVAIEDFGRAHGTGYVGDALFYVLLCSLFGVLFDRTGTYTWTFLICSGLLLWSFFCNILILYGKI